MAQMEELFLPDGVLGFYDEVAPNECFGPGVADQSFPDDRLPSSYGQFFGGRCFRQPGERFSGAFHAQGFNLSIAASAITVSRTLYFVSARPVSHARVQIVTFSALRWIQLVARTVHGSGGVCVGIARNRAPCVLLLRHQRLNGLELAARFRHLALRDELSIAVQMPANLGDARVGSGGRRSRAGR